MHPLHALAETFTPSARDGLAFSALPDAPVLPHTAPRRRLPLFHRGLPAAGTLRRIGVRVRSSLPLATTDPAPVRAECAPS